MIAPWITVDELEDPSSPYAQEAVEAASFVLWLLSARKYGGARTTTEVYCQIGLNDIGLQYPVADPGFRGYMIWPEIRAGTITNMIGGCGCSSCGCTHLLRLRGGPVLSIQSASIGDRLLTADEIAIYDYSHISIGASRCWNSCDDVEVTYTYGAPPPALGKIAARDLANQYVLAQSGSDECALPERVTQVSRQGVSWTLLDPQDFLDNGRTGLYRVDLFLRAVNPDKARLRARVFSPDIPRAKTRRTSAAAGGAPLMASYGLVVGGAGSPAATLSVTPFATPMTMAMPPPTPVAQGMPTLAMEPSANRVTVYDGRPLRWVVPGQFTGDDPPVVIVQPSGEEVPPGALLWRSSNYTLDLTADQAAELLPPGSALVVASRDDQGNITGSANYPVERRTA